MEILIILFLGLVLSMQAKQIAELRSANESMQANLDLAMPFMQSALDEGQGDVIQDPDGTIYA